MPYPGVRITVATNAEHCTSLSNISAESTTLRKVSMTAYA